MKSNCKKVYEEIHHNVKCRDMAGQKCQHMPKILSTELMAKECKTVYNKKCEHIPRSPAWSCWLGRTSSWTGSARGGTSSPP